MKTLKKHCPNKAKYILAWGGKLLKYCEVHANGICALGQAIGAQVGIESISTKVNCEGANDLDEYKKPKP